jgi:hypothetical protein
MNTENNQNKALNKTDVTSSVLTLEHLSIAITNNILVQFFDDEREILHNDCKIVSLREEEMTIANGEYEYEVSFDEVNLIVRPISDLRKDEYFDWYMDFCESLGMVNCYHLLEALEKGKYYSMSIEKYFLVEKFMNENHFDWRFNLIQNGLAVSKDDVA